jgi:hypothetical protein
MQMSLASKAELEKNPKAQNENALLIHFRIKYAGDISLIPLSIKSQPSRSILDKIKKDSVYLAKNI